MKKNGYTLIEVLISSVIMITILGTLISANRTIRNSAQIYEDQAQMQTLVDETGEMFWLVQQNSAWTSSMMRGVCDGTTSQLGMFYRKQITYGTGHCYNSGLCDPPERTNTTTVSNIKYCEQGDASCYTTNLGISVPGLVVQNTIKNQLDAGGEFIAIRRKKDNSPGSIDKIISALNYDNLVVAPKTTFDIYKRTVKLKCLETDSTDNANYAKANYSAEVTVSNYYNNSSSITKNFTYSNH